ncbi:MAG: hypothetical protein ACLFNM_01965 [Candidatus Woesearchaeota archaeon]
MKQDDTDFELLPHQELEKLREENTRLRQNPFKGRAEPHDLQGSVENLTHAITKLTKLFSATNEEMLADYQRGTLQEQIRQISSQNEKIAEGILTIAQMLQSSQNSTQNQNQNHDQGDFEQTQASLQNQTTYQDNKQAPVNPSSQTNPGINQNQPLQDMSGFEQPISTPSSQTNPQFNPAMNQNQMQSSQNTAANQQFFGAPESMPQQNEGPAQSIPPPPPPQHEKKKGFGLFKK